MINRKANINSGKTKIDPRTGTKNIGDHSIKPNIAVINGPLKKEYVALASTVYSKEFVRKCDEGLTTKP